ncbi:MAG: AAA family ATPase, partial [Pseudomonadota bacterium]
MSTYSRYIYSSVCSDLEHRKMVFIGGPRQVGKTTFALSLLEKRKNIKSIEQHPGYLNWDYPLSREKILKNEFPLEEELVIFDEIHKYSRWRNLVKGLYDVHKALIKFMVTGSARLDYYRKGGDSLLGRYHYYRLHPLTVHEYDGPVKDLLEYGGFPEPLFRKEKNFSRRWHRERIQKCIYEDLLNLEKVKEASSLDQLLELLPLKVGSPLSIKSLSEDLSLAHETVERYVKILERLYLVYRIAPYGPPKTKAVKKEKKLYLWDWSQISSGGARLENMVAGHLLKYCHFIEDVSGHEMELRFLRDVEGREIDFVVLKNKKAIFAVECKTGEKSISPHIHYFQQRSAIPLF